MIVALVVVGAIGVFGIGLVMGFVGGVGWTHANFPQVPCDKEHVPMVPMFTKPEEPKLTPELFSDERIQNQWEEARRPFTDGSGVRANGPATYRGPTDAPIPRIPGLD